MRILLISYRFPPYNAMGAVRASKTARYLTEFGHEVKVITAANQPLEATLPLEIPDRDVTHARWLNTNFLADLARGGKKAISSRGYRGRGPIGRVIRGLAPIYKTLFALPDPQIGWYPFACRAAARLLGGWRPDVILASAPPATSLLVAHSVARKHRIPWVAEFRDLWVSNNAYYDHPGWRRRFEARVEHRVLSSAAAFVTVSEAFAGSLSAEYKKPTRVVYNGFDPADYPPADVPAQADDAEFRIVYTGILYPGRRDPRLLFDALGRLGRVADGIRVEFYGRYLQDAHEAALERGIAHLVSVNDMVPYHDALRIQSSADVLLLLMWDDPGEYGTYPGKLFEYIGARRPILVVGRPEHLAAQLVNKTKTGVVSNDADEIAEQLREWLERKRANGMIPEPPEAATQGFTREEQTRKLGAFLQEIISGQ
jgi:glycosyltransferase involved in cell wall biosynthesis